MKYKLSKDRIAGWCVTLLMIGATFVTDALPPRFTEFYEGDIALSYSVHDTVPYRYVIIFCYIVPTILICIFLMASKPRYVSDWVHDAIYLSARTFATNEIITCLLKNFIGRPRPCFFQLCGYESQTTTLSNGQKVISYGTFGALGNVTKCHAARSNIYTAFRSFPSGHSSTAASSMVILILFLFHYIDARYQFRQHAIRIVKTGCSIPIIAWACFIFGSRIFDYRHRPEDVVGGIVCGTLSALYVWILHYPSQRSKFQGFSYSFFDPTQVVQETIIVLSVCWNYYIALLQVKYSF